ncbi:hypothetical protein OIE62_01035 [Streptomyces scopuliridis]|uniref:Uncharacterized protein n=1 Tax=Streptomyces scopuliridis TaxID=452529 RepID=A0ACD4ZWE5_9ACTN|nr:hypothetical protein [Streptomyces scopuliridis]WSC02714.1 hypothetical protein OG835_40800 [Streptomyces scopuliridis]WSC03754.1 hypothetical protein OIE62_01035 [Streptomyces scopuliridis]
MLEPLLPIGIKPGRPPVHSERQLIDGIRFRTRTAVTGQFQARVDTKGLISWDIWVDATIAH